MQKNSHLATKYIKNETFIPIIKEYINKGKNVKFRVRGYSMRPFLENDRDCAIISPIDKEKIKTGDVVLAEISENKYVLHRVAKREGNTITLRGDGNVYGFEYCEVDNIIGIAKAFILGTSKEKKIRTTSYSWIIYSFLWPNNSFLRRFFLFIYRKIFS